MSEPDAPPVPTRKQTLAVINQDLAVQLHAQGVVAYDSGNNKYICQLDKKLAKKCRQMERKSYLYAHFTSHAEKEEWGDLTSDAVEKLKAALASTSVALVHLTASSAAPPKRTRKAAVVARGKAAMEMHAATAQDDPLANVVDSVLVAVRAQGARAAEDHRAHIRDDEGAHVTAGGFDALLKKAITSAQHKFTLEDPVYDKLQRILVTTQPASFGMPLRAHQVVFRHHLGARTARRTQSGSLEAPAEVARSLQVLLLRHRLERVDASRQRRRNVARVHCAHFLRALVEVARNHHFLLVERRGRTLRPRLHRIPRAAARGHGRRRGRARRAAGGRARDRRGWRSRHVRLLSISAPHAAHAARRARARRRVLGRRLPDARRRAVGRTLVLDAALAHVRRRGSAGRAARRRAEEAQALRDRQARLRRPVARHGAPLRMDGRRRCWR